MKLIHTGDVHLGAALKNLPTDKARLRRDEITDAFRRLAQFAAKSGVAAVIIAGDFFDTETPSQYLQREVLSIIAGSPSVRFFYVTGNHDRHFRWEFPIPENLCLFDQGKGFFTYRLSDEVTITGADAAYIKQLNYAALQLPAHTFNLVTMHGALSFGGNDCSPEDDPVRIPLLKNKNINYLALGHIHTPPERASLDHRGKYRYCGCLEGRGYDETGEKGFYLLEVKGKTLVAETFVPFARRTVHSLTVDVGGRDWFSIEKEVRLRTDKLPEKDMLSLTLTGSRPQDGGWFPDRFAALLSAKFFAARIVDDSKILREIDPFDTSLRGEFFRLLDSATAPESIKDEAAQIALTALSGEELPL